MSNIVLMVLHATIVFYANLLLSAESSPSFLVPFIVHKIYDYHAPNFYLYLSLMAVQQYIRPHGRVAVPHNTS